MAPEMLLRQSLRACQSCRGHWGWSHLLMCHSWHLGFQAGVFLCIERCISVWEITCWICEPLSHVQHERFSAASSVILYLQLPYDGSLCWLLLQWIYEVLFYTRRYLLCNSWIKAFLQSLLSVNQCSLRREDTSHICCLSFLVLVFSCTFCLCAINNLFTLNRMSNFVSWALSCGLHGLLSYLQENVPTWWERSPS